MDLLKLKRQLNDAREMLGQRTAILWGGEELLGTAIESILTATRNWQVVKMLGSCDVMLLEQELDRSTPDIVIVNQGDRTDCLPLPIHLMQKFPELKIIAINSENNLLEIYHKQKIWIEEAKDLLTIIGKYPNSTLQGGDEQKNQK